jgi:hypothetical protein
MRAILHTLRSGVRSLEIMRPIKANLQITGASPISPAGVIRRQSDLLTTSQLVALVAAEQFTQQDLNLNTAPIPVHLAQIPVTML